METGKECEAIPAIDLVNNEVRGMTLQKLIVAAKVKVVVTLAEFIVG